MDGSIILRRLAALSRSRITQTAPARYFDGGYRQIKRCGRTNGRTLDLPRESAGGRIIEVSGQRGGKFSSRARHFLFSIAQKGELLLALPLISIPPKRLLGSATLKPLANFSEFFKI